MATSISMCDVIDAESGILNIPRMVREDEYGYRTSIEGKTVSPLTVLPLAQDFKITKSGGAVSATLKRFEDGFYTCSCPAWKFSTERDKFRKTCSHLQDVLGLNYENERIAIAKESRSNVWETTKARRTTSDSAQVRQAQAKSLLDNHYRELSQSQPSTSAVPAGSMLKRSTPQTSSAMISKTQQPAGTVKSVPEAKDDCASGSETEEEELARPSSLSTSSFLNSGPEPPKEVLKKRQIHHLSDNEDNPSQASSSKKPRRRQKATDDDDEKVSLLLAKSWMLDADPNKPRSKAMDPTSWWLSEKLDGVRAFWDGSRLYSRQKIEWNAPAWWKARLPKDITLDGELWMARGTFDQTSQICRSTVRLGRLRTFKHHLQRDSMERQWLREQVGGKQASQERVRLLQQAQQALADSVDSASHSKPVEPKMKGWKALKRLKLSVRTAFCSPLGDTLRTKLAQSFLAALVGPAQVKSALASPDKMMSRQHKVVRRCTGCGKRLGNKKKSRCLSDPVPAADASKVSRAHADQNPLATPSPSLETSFVPTFRPTRSTAFASHVCRRNPKNSTEWNRIKFMIFDAPSLGSLPVEDRWAELEKRFGTTQDLDIDDLEGPQIKLVRQVRCTSKIHLTELMKQVEAKGGEGLMLRKPGSKYEGKRGTTLYKLKSWYDAEAEVIGYADGSGKYQGHAGSLVARMECGTVFRVGTGMSDALRHNPPPLGTIINYRFFELSEDGYPRFPAFRGIARDKSRAKDAVVRPRASMIRAESEKALLAKTS